MHTSINQYVIPDSDPGSLNAFEGINNPLFIKLWYSLEDAQTNTALRGEIFRLHYAPLRCAQDDRALNGKTRRTKPQTKQRPSHAVLNWPPTLEGLNVISPVRQLGVKGAIPKPHRHKNLQRFKNKFRWVCTINQINGSIST